jgi:hypothetical protein
VEPNGLIDPTVVVVTGAQVMGSHPTANSLVLQILIQATGKDLILMGVTDKERVILNSGRSEDRGKILDGSVRKANTTEKV